MRFWRKRPAADANGGPAVNPPGEAERLLRRLDFTVIRRLDGLRQGEHRNAAYGSGLDLAELREYQPGDDVRALDWNVTARMDKPYVRRFHEDREVTAWLVLDLTASSAFGSGMQTKRDLLLDAAGTLARLLTARNDRVGALLYTGSRPFRRPPRGNGWWGPNSAGESEKMPAELVRAGSGRLHVLHVLERTMAAMRRGSGGQGSGGRAYYGEAVPEGTYLSALLEQAFRTAKERSLIILLSDFLDAGADPQAWQRAFAPLARRHEVVGVWVRDPTEVALPPVGVLTFQDAETGEQLEVDTSQPSLREAYARLAAARERDLQRLFALHGSALWTLSTSEPFVPALVSFLDQRRRTAVGARRVMGTAV